MNKGCYIIYLKPWNIFKFPSYHLIYGTSKTVLLAGFREQSEAGPVLASAVPAVLLRLPAWSHITVTQRICLWSQHSTMTWQVVTPPERAHRRHTMGSFLTRGGRWRPEVRLSEWAGETRGVLLFTGGCQAPQDTGQMQSHSKQESTVLRGVRVTHK